MNGDVVIARRLTKNFNGLIALNNVSLTVKKGEIFCLLGPNGAGKTTLISILATLIKPTSGDAEICGFNLQERDKIRQRITLVPQELALDLPLSVYDNLYFYAWLQGFPKAMRKKKVEEIIHEFDMDEKINVPVIRLSGGLMRRVQLARAFLSNADLYFFDEPTLGLDPVGTFKAWSLIKKLAASGKTIILATNNMHEAETLSDRIAFINKGKLITVDTPQRLKDIAGVTTVKVIFRGNIETENIKTMLDIDNLRISQNSIEVVVKQLDSTLVNLLNLVQSQAEIIDMQVTKPSLDDVFIKLVNKNGG